MQSGRGGGLAESFSSAESMFGTQTNSFMVNLSTTLAVIFFSTALVLAVSSARGEKSLMTHAKLPVNATQTAKQEEPSVKVSGPKPMNEGKPFNSATAESSMPKASPTPVSNTAK